MDAEDRFRLLAGLALVDARLARREQRVLLRAAHGLGLERERASEILRDLQEGGRVSNLTPPSEPREREQLFRSMIDLVIADGEVTPQEHQCLTSLGPSFGLQPPQVSRLLQVALAEGRGSAIGAAAPVSLAAPTAEPPRPRSAPKRVTQGTASCPSCSAPIEFKNARSVAAVCEYCDTTVARADAGGALEDLGKVSHVVDNGSPIQVGARGTCFGVEFTVLGLLQVEHETGFWNEWYLEWADRRTGWLGEALGQYLVTFPGKDGQPEIVPPFDKLAVGQRVFLGSKRYVVSEVRRARATGTQGETPFVVTEGYELPYADLRRSDDGFATIDYSEELPLAFTGRCVRWKDLAMRGYRRFDGWRA